jgi:hypothetical protein
MPFRFHARLRGLVLQREHRLPVGIGEPGTNRIDLAEHEPKRAPGIDLLDAGRTRDGEFSC